MESKPSYLASTLSQLAVGSAIFYAIGAIATTSGVITGRIDLNMAKALMGPFEFIVVTFGVSYLAVRKNGNGNGHVPPTPPSA